MQNIEVGDSVTGMMVIHVINSKSFFEKFLLNNIVCFLITFVNNANHAIYVNDPNSNFVNKSYSNLIN